MQPNITVTQPKYNLYKYILIRLSRNEGKWFIWHLVKWNIRVYVFMGDWVMDCLIDVHSNERLRKLFCYVRIWRLYECTTNTQNLNGLQCLVPAECWFDVFCVWGLFSDLTNFRRTKMRAQISIGFMKHDELCSLVVHLLFLFNMIYLLYQNEVCFPHQQLVFTEL